MNIKQLIKNASITQVELAKRLGITQQTVSQMINKEKDALTLGYLRKISAATNIPLSVLIGENQDVTQKVEEQDALGGKNIAPGVHDISECSVIYRDGRAYLCSDIAAVARLLSMLQD